MQWVSDKCQKGFLGVLFFSFVNHVTIGAGWTQVQDTETVRMKLYTGLLQEMAYTEIRQEQMTGR